MRERRVFHGRRHGRRLRSSRARQLETGLAALSVDLSNPPIDPHRLFVNSTNASVGNPIKEAWLEIGFGAGEHLAAQAEAHPGVGFIGCEPFMNGVARLMTDIDERGLKNIRVHPDDARDLLDALPDGSISRCFILFPDPWPKARHNNRRIVSRENLDSLARVLSDGAELRLASDHMEYIRWMLFHILRHGAFEWVCRGPADWRRRPADASPTRYEEKALARGDACVYLRFNRRHR
ncbi:MAG: tRNA (guanosine(46)-N7)-methyltransferase TrmB [Rhodospirillaceae bacterium]|jgi:tRNA (guanine-N7-)-methyltransferase|nr:tRNA (guanosine(46)-N7)-methyltransferase TrmB [Rhodospirillaceae bacterium]MBT5667745.1 tRNA (guanosine(46)-N7)-methyltransferase TrmB [Rhodospirillaceae bacterium]MBT5809756.1 tRNA (guanosine(46)-N7)-methyltransferase TrmB [Rhodospirillaceae bacterium]